LGPSLSCAFLGIFTPFLHRAEQNEQNFYGKKNILSSIKWMEVSSMDLLFLGMTTALWLVMVLMVWGLSALSGDKEQQP
jgi:hypothetical protein